MQKTCPHQLGGGARAGCVPTTMLRAIFVRLAAPAWGRSHPPVIARRALAHRALVRRPALPRSLLLALVPIAPAGALWQRQQEQERQRAAAAVVQRVFRGWLVRKPTQYHCSTLAPGPEPEEQSPNADACTVGTHVPKKSKNKKRRAAERARADEEALNEGIALAEAQRLELEADA